MTTGGTHWHYWRELLRGFAGALSAQAVAAKSERMRAPKTLDQIVQSHRAIKQVHSMAEALENSAELLRAAAVCPPDCTHRSHQTLALKTQVDTADMSTLVTTLKAFKPKKSSYHAPINDQIRRFLANCSQHPDIANPALASAVKAVKYHQRISRLLYGYYRAEGGSERAIQLLELGADLRWEKEQELESELEASDEAVTEGDADVTIYSLDGIQITRLYHPLWEADAAAEKLSRRFRRNREAVNLLKEAEAAIERAIRHRDRNPGNAEDLKSAAAIVRTHTQKFGSRYDAEVASVIKRGRPSIHADRYSLIAALVDVAPPGSPAELAEILATRYQIFTTAKQVSTDLHNMEREDSRRPRDARVRPRREKQKPGRRP